MMCFETDFQYQAKTTSSWSSEVRRSRQKQKLHDAVQTSVNVHSPKNTQAIATDFILAQYPM